MDQESEYSFNELTDMILVIGECKKNYSLASQVYRQRYPGRMYPDEHFLRRLTERLYATGDLIDVVKNKSTRSPRK